MAQTMAALAFEPRPSDILIAVMGITGSGKSTFISHCTDKSVSIGEGLHSHTQDIVVYPCKPDVGANVYLIDTPGFDDTQRDDTEILRQIADWVGEKYERKIHLRGILYLHRITDIRMQGAAIKNLFMFKKLCGNNALQNVILATTMWEGVRQDIGQQREEELRTNRDYWGEMIGKGSRIARHQNHYESARGIIHTLLKTTKQTTLAIQKEMVDEKKDLVDTSAGRELDGILTQERERFARNIEQLKQDMAIARELQDRESQEQIRRLQQQRQIEIDNLIQQQNSMKVSLEQLHEEKFAKLERLLNTQQSQMERDRLVIVDLKQQLANDSLKSDPEPNHNTKSWDTRAYSCLQKLKGHGGSVQSVAFSPFGHLIASGSSDYNIKIWDITTGNCLKTLKGRKFSLWSMAFLLKGHTNSVWSVAFSPDGRCIASGSSDATIKTWDSTTGSCLQTLKGHGSTVWSVAFSPYDRCIASGSDDHTVKIWNTSTGSCLQTLEGHSSPVQSVAFSPDGRRIASGSGDGTVKTWNTTTGNCLQTLKDNSSPVRSVAFSPDGLRIASGSIDGVVKTWNTTTGSCLQTLKGHSYPVRSVAFSPDGCCIASGSSDGTVKTWNNATGGCLQTLKGHISQVQSVAFSPDGRRIVSGSSDDTIRIWDSTART